MATAKRARRIGVALSGSLLLLAAAAPVAAHVTVPDGGGIHSGSSAVIHFRVSHGCGDLPTDTVAVQLPDGIVGAQAAWVPGWDVTTEMVDSEPYERFGETFSERVGVITWSGGSLPADVFHDFGIRATFLVEPGEVRIPVVQLCGEEQEAWIEIPADGQDPDELEYPAPGIVIVEAAEGADEG